MSGAAGNAGLVLCGMGLASAMAVGGYLAGCQATNEVVAVFAAHALSARPPRRAHPAAVVSAVAEQGPKRSADREPRVSDVREPRLSDAHDLVFDW